MAFNYSPKIVTDGLVLCLDAANTKSYPGSGTVWSDLSRGGNNGTLTNGPTFNSANGGSIVFDGVNDYVNLGNILNNIISGFEPKYTLSIWVKLNSLTINQNYFLISKSGDTNFSENERQLNLIIRNLPAYSYNGYQLEFFKYNQLDTSQYRSVRTTGSGLSINTFYNLAVTFDSSIDTNNGLDRVNLYFNGMSQSKTFSFLAGTLSDSFQAGEARLSIGAQIGRKITNSPISLLNGDIYQTQIYNRALSATEILQNYNATKSRFGL